MKKELRKAILQERAQLTLIEVQDKSERIARSVIALPEYQQAKVVMMYVAFRNEVDTGIVITHALEHGKKVVIPITDRANTRLIPSQIIDYPDDLTPGAWGILEPKPECVRPVAVEDIDLVLVPGVSFDAQGNRLGYGGGFYDRFTITLKRGVKLVALAFGLQLRDDVYPEEHDNPVDYVVTESNVIVCR